MRKMMMLGVAAALALAVTGCTTVIPHNGSFVDNNVRPQKVGESKISWTLCFRTSGDAGINAAMKDGNITKVHHVQMEHFVFPLFYQSITTKVYGE